MATVVLPVDERFAALLEELAFEDAALPAIDPG